MRKLDFLCIGAGKSGTTSLFHYLKEHPDIFIPEEKELPFFTNDVNEEDYDKFINKYFATEANLIGKITPSYMGDSDIPKRIHQFLPNVKLIVLLRNPIDRAYSYYLMKNKKVAKPLPFDQIIARKFNDLNSISFIKRSNYGQIISEYLRFFNREQLKIVFSDDFERDRESTFDEILQFLGFSAGFRPKSLNKKYYEGGSTYRFKTLHKRLYKIKLIRTMFKSALPKNYRIKLKRWYLMELNTVKKIDKLDAKSREILVEHFRRDVEMLTELLNLETPWLEFQNKKNNEG